MDKISVIIPVYNAEKTISRCIESIQKNRGRNILFCLEIIIVNDGSTDYTLNIIKKIQENDPDIIILTQSNKGVSAARNLGLQNITGNYVTFADADDWVEKDWLGGMYERIIKYDADISVERAIIEGKNVLFNPNEISLWNHEEAQKIFIYHKELNGILWNKLFKRELVNNVFFNESMTYGEDALFVWEILKSSVKIIKANIGTYHYSITPNSLSRKAIDYNKLYSIYTLWERIVNDCDIKNLRKLSLEKRNQVYLGTFNQMFKDNYRNEFYEKKMQLVLRRYFFHINQTKLRLFALFIIINPSLGRLLYKLK